jgi:hypothetical protein
MNFISIGGWCGTKIALKDLGLFDEKSLPFDDVRSSIEGIIDCIENDFKNYLPKEIKKNDNVKNYLCFTGEYFGFYHQNLLDKMVIESIERKIIRFDEKIKKNNCIFLRTIIRDNKDEELKYYKKLQEVIDKKYPGISYVICFLIPNQLTTQYYKNLDNRTFLFTLNDKSLINVNLKNEYKPIFDFIIKENLFNSIPISNDISINNDLSDRLWLVDGFPVVNLK